jgi:hypothetical protein
LRKEEGEMKEKKPVIPILKAEPRDDDPTMLKVWCPFCLCYHLHGRSEGHRVAHCPPELNTPFEKTGYYIALDPEAFRKKNRIRKPRWY